MNFNKPKTNAKQPVIRKTVVNVPITQEQRIGTPQPAQPVRPPPANRFQPTGRRKDFTNPKKPPPPVQRALSAARGVKRKSATPQPALFDSSDEDESSDIGASDSDISRKRIKSSVSSVDSGGPRRNLLDERAFDKAQAITFVQGADVTSGRHAAKYKHPWSDDDFECVALQYPTKSPREKFELKFPKNEMDDYKPLEDIAETIETIASFYFPDELIDKYTSQVTGFRRQFNRAWQRESIEEFVAVVEDFNSVVTKLVEDGSTRKELLRRTTLDKDWIKRILEQITARTVSPDVETVRAYQNGTDYVYGELLQPLVSQIFHETKLNHEQVFVDLGSGVGNVVLQAALEVGCDSWGIEYMDAPSKLAKRQEREFPARARLWGVSVGAVHLIKGDFTDNKEISDVLKRADVVLVNNQAFTPALNDKLRDMFLDLKEGCRIASLKPFVPLGHKITTRNVSSVVNKLQQREFEYFSESVSWTDAHGKYYIATVDTRPLQAFMKRNNMC